MEIKSFTAMLSLYCLNHLMKENHQIQTDLNNINLFYANTVNQPMFHTREPWDLGSSAEWWHEYFAHLHDWFAHQSAHGWKPQVKGFLHIYGETKKIFLFWTTGYLSKALFLLNWFSLCRYYRLEFRRIRGRFLPQAPWLRECHCLNRLSTPRNLWKAQECFRQND